MQISAYRAIITGFPFASQPDRLAIVDAGRDFDRDQTSFGGPAGTFARLAALRERLAAAATSGTCCDDTRRKESHAAGPLDLTVA
ncbi:MAG: hypothetical protein ACE5EC_03095, partial [Phycisphaerae bacterium]